MRAGYEKELAEKKARVCELLRSPHYGDATQLLRDLPEGFALQFADELEEILRMPNEDGDGTSGSHLR